MQRVKKPANADAPATTEEKAKAGKRLLAVIRYTITEGLHDILRDEYRIKDPKKFEIDFGTRNFVLGRFEIEIDKNVIRVYDMEGIEDYTVPDEDEVWKFIDEYYFLIDERIGAVVFNEVPLKVEYVAPGVLYYAEADGNSTYDFNLYTMMILVAEYAEFWNFPYEGERVEFVLRYGDDILMFSIFVEETEHGVVYSYVYFYLFRAIS